MAYYVNPRKYFNELAMHGARPKLLCEGDSWFSIPDLCHIPAQLDKMLDASILCVAAPGDTLLEIAEGAQLSTLKWLIHDVIDGQRWDAILLSAGGNDIIGDGMQYFLQNTDPSSDHIEDYINQDALSERMALMRRRLSAIIALRDGSIANPSTPILIHTYSYLTPRNVAHKVLAWGISGPWIYPYMINKGIVDCALQKDIVVYLLDRFHGLLTEMAEQPNANLHVVDARLALPRLDCAKRGQQSKSWYDEIHPTSKGFALLARDYFVPKLKSLGVV